MINYDKNSNFKKVKVVQVSSSIGKPKDQNQTLKGLGLNKIDRCSVLDYNSSVIGMINKVSHLVKYEFLEN